MIPRHPTFSVVALAALAVLAAGCGGSGSSSGGDTSGSTKTSGSSPAGQSAGAAAVTISSFAFHPGTVTVKAGARVPVSNKDSTAHTATADSGGFDTGDIAPGASATVSVAKAGTYKYHCSIHPFMHGTLVVK